jgi:hypothetical protein
MFAGGGDVEMGEESWKDSSKYPYDGETYLYVLD